MNFLAFNLFTLIALILICAVLGYFLVSLIRKTIKK